MATSAASVYSDAWLQHGRDPHHFGRLNAPSHTATGLNAMCGDKVIVELKLTEDTISEYAFRAVGCTICVAAGSLLGDACLHQNWQQSQIRIEKIALALEVANKQSLEPPFDALTQVLEFPTRIKCATLALRTMLAACDAAETLITTE